MDTNTVGLRVLEDSVAEMKRSIDSLMDAGVRKSAFFPLIAESLAATKGEPRQLRRAKAFEYLLDHVALEVLPHDVIGGSILGMWPIDSNAKSYDEHRADAVATIDAHLASGQDEYIVDTFFGRRRSRFALMARDHYDADIRFEDMQKIIKEMQEKYADAKIRPYEIANLLEHLYTYDYGDEVNELINGLPWFSANHVHLNYGMIINTGYGAVLADIEKRLAAANDPEKKEFYTAAKIAMEACIRYIKRYAAAYEKAADEELDELRATRFERIAAALDKVSTEKADGFFEAMQLMWITHIISNTELGSAMSFARFDQYMRPFYEKSIESGEITKDEAKEMLCCMMLKVNEPKMRTVQSLVLSGTTPDGKDGTSELTRTFLEASRLVRLPYPNLAVRVSEGRTPEWLYDECIETIKCGFGMPMLINEDVWIKNFHELGYPLEVAREFYNMGCVEMLLASRNFWTSPGVNNPSFPEFVDDVLNDFSEGKLRLDTFGELFEEVQSRIREHISSTGGAPAHKAIQERFADYYDPFGSVLMIDCLEKGRDMYQGGLACPPHVAYGGRGIATAVDSLNAIKTLVFDQKKISLADLMKAVKSDFEGQENLRQLILSSTSHYGNDDDAVDELAGKLFATFTQEVYKHNQNSNYEKYVSSYFSYTSSVSTGELLGSTPDGRLRSEPLSDGLGPSQGRDSEGPTKLLNTLLKLDYSRLNGALATNMKINSSLFGTKTGTLALKNMLKAYLRDGGPQVQLNFVKQEDLLDAQKNPSKHRDLVVRIAGFCEYFVNLDFQQQNEVIKRTEHEMG